MNEEKLDLYLDVDDVILESTSAIIDILNIRHNINPPKTIKNYKWDLRSIWADITVDEILDMYSSQEFFDKVNVNQTFLENYEWIRDNFNVNIVTKGRQTNLCKKIQYLKDMGVKYDNFIGIEFDEENPDFSKACVDMTGGIQIDDKYECLADSNASIKILLNFRRFKERYKTVQNQQIYLVDNWAGIIECLKFFVEHQEFVEDIA